MLLKRDKAFSLFLLLTTFSLVFLLDEASGRKMRKRKRRGEDIFDLTTTPIMATQATGKTS